MSALEHQVRRLLSTPRSLARGWASRRSAMERRILKAADRGARVAAERIRILEERLRILESNLGLDLEEEVAAFGALLRPLPSRHQFERIGSTKDGGYVVPVDIPRPDAIVSVGVGSECSADDAMAERGISVWQFDHTVESSPAVRPEVTFTRLGVQGSGGPESPDRLPLKDLVERCGAPREAHLWLMLDAEGVEWDVANDLHADLDRFDLMAIEFHRLSWLMNPVGRRMMMKGISRLRATHTPLVWNPNNYGPTTIIGGVFVPDVLEVTFVRNALFAPADGTSQLVSGLVRPNNPHGYLPPEPFSKCPENAYGPVPDSMRPDVPR